MKKEFVKGALIVALIAVAGLAYSQESVMLKYDFVKGKTYVQDALITQSNTQSMGGQEIKVVAEMKLQNEFTVESTGNDGNATILVSYPGISVHTSMPGRDTTLNYENLKDKSRVVYSITGKSLSSVKVDSSSVSKIVDQMDVNKFRILPGRLVKVGEKWQDKIVENKKASSGSAFAMETVSDMEYALVGKENKDGREYFKILCSGTINVTGKGTQMGMEMYIEGTGKTEGFYYFDPQTSLVVYTEDVTEMNMNVAVSGTQNMTIPMTQNVKSVTKLKEKI